MIVVSDYCAIQNKEIFSDFLKVVESAGNTALNEARTAIAVLSQCFDVWPAQAEL